MPDSARRRRAFGSTAARQLPSLARYPAAHVLREPDHHASALPPLPSPRAPRSALPRLGVMRHPFPRPALLEPAFAHGAALAEVDARAHPVPLLSPHHRRPAGRLRPDVCADRISVEHQRAAPTMRMLPPLRHASCADERGTPVRLPTLSSPVALSSASPAAVSTQEAPQFPSATIAPCPPLPKHGAVHELSTPAPHRHRRRRRRHRDGGTPVATGLAPAPPSASISSGPSFNTPSHQAGQALPARPPSAAPDPPLEQAAGAQQTEPKVEQTPPPLATATSSLEANPAATLFVALHGMPSALASECAQACLAAAAAPAVLPAPACAQLVAWLQSAASALPGAQRFAEVAPFEHACAWCSVIAETVDAHVRQAVDRVAPSDLCRLAGCPTPEVLHHIRQQMPDSALQPAQLRAREALVRAHRRMWDALRCRVARGTGAPAPVRSICSDVHGRVATESLALAGIAAGTCAVLSLCCQHLTSERLSPVARGEQLQCVSRALCLPPLLEMCGMLHAAAKRIILLAQPGRVGALPVRLPVAVSRDSAFASLQQALLDAAVLRQAAEGAFAPVTSADAPCQPLVLDIFPHFVTDRAGCTVTERGEGHGPRKEMFALASRQATQQWAAQPARLPCTVSGAAGRPILMADDGADLRPWLRPGMHLEVLDSGPDPAVLAAGTVTAVPCSDRAVLSTQLAISFQRRTCQAREPRTPLLVYHRGSETHWLNAACKETPALRRDFWFLGFLIASCVFNRATLAVRLALPLCQHLLGTPGPAGDMGVGSAGAACDAAGGRSDGAAKWCPTVNDWLQFDPEARATVRAVEAMDSAALQELATAEGLAADAGADALLAAMAANALCHGVAWQLQQVCDGFRAVIPTSWLDVLALTAQQLQEMVCGGHDSEGSPAPLRTVFLVAADDELLATPELHAAFWDVVDALSAQDRRRFLKFVTGVEQLPAPGTEVRNFSFHRRQECHMQMLIRHAFWHSPVL